MPDDSAEQLSAPQKKEHARKVFIHEASQGDPSLAILEEILTDRGGQAVFEHEAKQKPQESSTADIMALLKRNDNAGLVADIPIEGDDEQLKKIWDTLGGHEIESNPVVEKIITIVQMIDEKRDPSTLAETMTSLQKAQAQVILATSGLHHLLTQTYSAKHVYKLQQILGGSNNKDANAILSQQLKLLKPILDGVKKGSDSEQDIITHTLVGVCSISHMDGLKLYKRVMKQFEGVLPEYTPELYMHALYEAYKASGLLPELTSSLDETEVQYIADQIDFDTQELTKLKRQLDKGDYPEKVHAYITNKILIRQLLDSKQVDQEVISAITSYDMIASSIATIAKAGWDKLPDKLKSYFIEDLSQHSSKLAETICVLIEQHTLIPNELITLIGNVDYYQKQKIIESAIKSKYYEQFKAQIPNFDPEEWHPSALFGPMLKAAKETHVAIPSDMFEAALSTQAKVEHAFINYLTWGGVKMYSELSVEAMDQVGKLIDAAAAQPWSSQNSELVISALWKQGLLHTFNTDVLRQLTISPGHLRTLMMNNPEVNFPEILKEKVKTMWTNEENRIDFLRLAVRRGSLDVLAEVGGKEFIDICLDSKSGHDYTYMNLLDTVIECGWHSAPDPIKKLLLNHPWEYFNSRFLDTRDTLVIAQIAERGGFTLDNAKKWAEIDKREEYKPYYVLFAGCSQEDVNETLHSEEFVKQYPEYHARAKQTNSLGEQALIIRSAYKSIPFDHVQKLIDLARTQTLRPSSSHTNFKAVSTSLLTSMHHDGVYFERWRKPDRESLLWDDSMKKYFEENPATYKAEELIRIIESGADPQNEESVFWLIDNPPLKEGETLSQENFQELAINFLGRPDVPELLMKRLLDLAGWNSSEDFEALFEHEVSSYPLRERITNIAKYGNILPDKYKELSLRFLQTDVYLDYKVFEIFFDHLKDTPFAYTAEEKRLCWETFRDRSSGFNTDVATLQFYQRENVLTSEDIHVFAKKCFSQNAEKEEMTKFLLPQIFTDADKIQEYVTSYLASENGIHTTTVELMYKYIQDNGLKTEETSALFKPYLTRKDVDTNSLYNFLQLASDDFSTQEIRVAIINVTNTEYGTHHKLINIFEEYPLSPEDYRILLASSEKSRTGYTSEIIAYLLDHAQFDEQTMASHFKRLLFDDSGAIFTMHLETYANRLPYETVFYAAVDYIVKQPQLNDSHLTVLTRYLYFKDEDRFNSLWDEVKKLKPEYAFFEKSELVRRQAAPQELQWKEGYWYLALPPIESNETLDLQEDSRVYYRNHLLFAENKFNLDGHQVQEILGPELYEKLRAIKEQALHTVLAEGDNPWILSREKSLGHFSVLGHGTGQAYDTKRERARADETNLSSREVVKAIVQGPDGVGVRWEKATAGAFFTNKASTYGSVEMGTVVLFFPEDLLESHVDISLDPGKGDGLVGRDIKSGRFNQIPNRVVLNPQGGMLFDKIVNDKQMAAYLMQLKYELSKYPDLVKQVEEAGLRYEREVLGHDFIEEVAVIHRQMRQNQYPEGAILWARDYYTSLRLQKDSESQELAAVFSKFIHAIDQGQISEDIRSAFDNVRLTWHLGLREQINPLMPPAEILKRANKLQYVLQRQKYLAAMKALRGANGEYRGVARQHMLQLQSAVKNHDVAPHSIRDNLETTKAVFFDYDPDKNFFDFMDTVDGLAQDTAVVKRSVLRTTFNSSLEQLSEEKKQVYEKYKDRIGICASGSIGREEAVISSDLDYLVLLDDEGLEADEILEIRKMLAEAGNHINATLEKEFQVRPDAGLGNRDRQPIVQLTDVKKFSYELHIHKQMIEPTEVLDATSIYPEGDELTNQFKLAFLHRNQELMEQNNPNFKEYIDRDIEQFMSYYNGGISQYLNGDQLIDFKLQLQRVFNFKIYALLSASFEKLKENNTPIPNATMDKIQVITDAKTVTLKQGEMLTKLQVLLYRIRYRQDVLTSAKEAEAQEARGDTKAKVVAAFDPRALSATERTQLLELFNEFNKLLEEDTHPVN